MALGRGSAGWAACEPGAQLPALLFVSQGPVRRPAAEDTPVCPHLRCPLPSSWHREATPPCRPQLSSSGPFLSGWSQPPQSCSPRSFLLELGCSAALGQPPPPCPRAQVQSVEAVTSSQPRSWAESEAGVGAQGAELL